MYQTKKKNIHFVIILPFYVKTPQGCKNFTQRFFLVKFRISIPAMFMTKKNIPCDLHIE